MYGKHKPKAPLGADKQDILDKLISLFYGVVTPMLNSIIYSLRSKDVKAAVKKLVSQKHLTEQLSQIPRLPECKTSERLIVSMGK